MQRIGILTAGGDTPALNATIYGAVQQANQRNIEMIGLVRGYDALFHPRLPHVRLNPLFQPIPELNPARGGDHSWRVEKIFRLHATRKLPSRCWRTFETSPSMA